MQRNEQTRKEQNETNKKTTANKHLGCKAITAGGGGEGGRGGGGGKRCNQAKTDASVPRFASMGLRLTHF